MTYIALNLNIPTNNTTEEGKINFIADILQEISSTKEQKVEMLDKNKNIDTPISKKIQTINNTRLANFEELNTNNKLDTANVSFKKIITLLKEITNTDSSLNIEDNNIKSNIINFSQNTSIEKINNNNFTDKMNNTPDLVSTPEENIKEITSTVEKISSAIITNNNEHPGNIKNSNMIEEFSNPDISESLNDVLTKIEEKISSLLNIRENNNVINKTKISISNLNQENHEKNNEDKILSKIAGCNTKTELHLNSIKTISPESIAIKENTLSNDIAKNITFMIKQNYKEMKVKIYPKELGELTIKIVNENGKINAKIEVEDKEAFKLITSTSNVEALKKELSTNQNNIPNKIDILLKENIGYSSNQSSSNFNKEEQSNNHDKERSYKTNTNEIKSVTDTNTAEKRLTIDILI